MTKNIYKQGFAPIAIILVVVAVLAVSGGTYYYQNQREKAPADTKSQGTTGQLPEALDNNQAPPPPENNQTQPPPPPQDETAGWKTYRNETYGFEFKYPPQINGRPVVLSERKNYNDFILFQSKTPYGSQTEGKGGEIQQSYFTNLITFSAHNLKKDFTYPESRGKIYTPTLTIGVDGNSKGGYIFDPKENKWRARNNSQQEQTWDEIYEYLETSAPKNMPTVETASGPVAFSYSGSSYEDYWDGYKIFETEKFTYLDFRHSYGYIPDDIKTEIEEENKAILKFLKKVMKTVKFF